MIRRRTRAAVRDRPQLLTRSEVAARFGVSGQTITRWANEGLISCVRTLGGQRRYDAAEVERLVVLTRQADAITWGRIHGGPRRSQADSPEREQGMER